MAEVIYDGPQPARDITLTSGKRYHAVKGEPVDVPAKVRDGLIRQRHWRKPKETKSAEAVSPAKED